MIEAISVSKLNNYIKKMFLKDFLLNQVKVIGEITDWKESRGSFYFNIKDENSSIKCIILYGTSVESDIKLDKYYEGMEVILEGKVSIYEKNGTYSLYVKKITSFGLGQYFVALNELKNKLKEKGMFDEIYKKPIKKYSINIGVVTSSNGAAIKDIEKTIFNKNPYAKIFLYPSNVQGSNAVNSIINGIEKLDSMNLDTIIIGRGGGATEDLFCFNDENLAYVVFNAKTPIISAVGHEINDTIIDYVADLRVATPTAAGEAATFSYDEYINTLGYYYDSFYKNIVSKLENYNEKLDVINDSIFHLSPKYKFELYNNKITDKLNMLKTIINNKLNNNKLKLNHYYELLKSNDILSRFEKGLSYVTNVKNKKINTVKQLKNGDKIFITFKDGKAKSIIEEIEKF